MNKNKLLLRIIASPAILLLLTISHAYFVIKRFVSYIRWGGEVLLFTKDERKNIQNIYEMLEEMKAKEKPTTH